MKKLLFLITVCSLTLQLCAQNNGIAQLRKALQQHPQQDTARVNLLNELGYAYDMGGDEKEKLATEALAISNKTNYLLGKGNALAILSDAKSASGNKSEAAQLIQQAKAIAEKIGSSCMLAHVFLTINNINFNVNNNLSFEYVKKAEAIALKLNDKKLIFMCEEDMASIYIDAFTNYPMALEYMLKAENIAEEINNLPFLEGIWSDLGTLYSSIGDQQNALLYYQKAMTANKEIGDTITKGNLLNDIGERYRLMGNYSEAITCYNQSLSVANAPMTIELDESNLADVYTSIDSLAPAFAYSFSSLVLAKQLDDQVGVAWIDNILSRASLKQNRADSGLYYATQGLAVAKQTGTIEFMRDNAEALANAYAFKKDFEHAYTYHLLFVGYRDSMINTEITNKTAVLQYSYNLDKKQAEITTLNQQQKNQRNFLIAALVVLMLIIITAAMLLRNNRQKQKANRLLQKQKHEIEHQRDQTDKALAELQQTQKQLVQSEKMASLGELTAGIAHEIQNPLNFVNNFSEVNRELIEELRIKNEKLIIKNDEVNDLLNDLAENEEKINHHGKRADAIVKGMLQHSRQTTGVKEATDINALCNEYLKLSYHGLRAKDKNFNADFTTDFDESIGKINLVPQDIGRVLLNLFNNAFYAVNEKQKTADEKYKPLVLVSTKKSSEKIEIKVSDNGNGIPQNIIDKIFQPFFTTKPTGQGTGLGLSLAYDIITKEHNGTIKAESEESKGGKFIIHLPMT